MKWESDSADSDIYLKNESRKLLAFIKTVFALGDVYLYDAFITGGPRRSFADLSVAKDWAMLEVAKVRLKGLS